MSGLVIKLKPHESMLVNGVVLQNGPRASRLRVRTSDASILRLRDALHPSEATTPVRRLYYMAQLALALEIEPEKASAEIVSGLKDLGQALNAKQFNNEFDRAALAASDRKFFKVMRILKKFFALESELLIREREVS